MSWQCFSVICAVFAICCFVFVVCECACVCCLFLTWCRMGWLWWQPPFSDAGWWCTGFVGIPTRNTSSMSLNSWLRKDFGKVIEMIISRCYFYSFSLFVLLVCVCVYVWVNVSVVVMVARGCGGLELTSHVPFSAERTSDFNAAVELVRARHPKSQLFAMGFSLGASLTLKYMADYADTTPVTGALAVCPPWDLTCPYSYSFQMFWTFLLASLLKAYALPHMWQLGRKYMKIFLAPTMYSFDNMIAPLHGFKDAHEYYVASSPSRVMHRIQKPTLVLSAIDDPVCNVNGCPTDNSRWYELLQLPYYSELRTIMYMCTFLLSSSYYLIIAYVCLDLDLDWSLQLLNMVDICHLQRDFLRTDVVGLIACLLSGLICWETKRK